MIISAQNIYKSYYNKIGKISRSVFEDAGIKVEKGDKIMIAGRSGSGKTTLLNLFAGFDKPDSGKILFKDNVLSDMKTKDILNYRNQTIGFVFQFHNLLPQCTLLENVLLPALTTNKTIEEKTKRASDLLKFMDLWDIKDNKPGELSGGECQRAALVRAMINNPEILLADEPTGSLDEKNAELLINLLCEINKETGITIIIASHSNEIAKKMDITYHIKNRKIERL